ncbi:MAG: ATP synthase F1 subunit epsilon [bacterium]|nr:ATP synthase F1 subunit epsilon [bacterium]
MTPERMQLQVVTSTDATFKTTVTELYIPAYLGEAGVLENHKPYISLLRSGEIVYTDISNKKKYLYIHEGFIEVLKNKVSIISDSVEKGEDLVIASEEIEAKLEKLAARIKSSLKGEITPGELEEAIREQKEYTIKLEITKKIEQGK